MSPLPLRTSTAMRQVGGSPASEAAVRFCLPLTIPGRTRAPIAATRTTGTIMIPATCRTRPREGGAMSGRPAVSWRARVVAGSGERGQVPGTLVGTPVPRRSREQDGMAPVAAVGRCDHLRAALVPHLDHAVDRRR